MGVTRMGKTAIFLADDDGDVRRTLRAFFGGLPGHRVVGEAYGRTGAVKGCRALAPDTALLDIRMPPLGDVSVARQILADRAAKCVVILTIFSDRGHIERMQVCRAVGYLIKPFEAEKILPTIELYIVRNREYYLLNKGYQYLSRRCQNRKPTDQVKLLLMEARGMHEEEAYQYVRELSCREGMSTARVANYLLVQQEERYDQRHVDVPSEIHGSRGRGDLLPGVPWRPAPRPGQHRAGGCLHRLPDRQRALYHCNL